MSEIRYDAAIVANSELGIKSKPVRARLTTRLVQNIRASLRRRNVKVDKVVREAGRIYFFGADVEKICEASRGVFGVGFCSPVIFSGNNLNEIVEATAQFGFRILANHDTFAIDARRVGAHSFTSKDIEIQAGAEILDKAGKERNLHVDLKNPKTTIFVEVREKRTIIYGQICHGPGGLPYGTQGKVVSLFTCDGLSALASWLMMRRGSAIIPVFVEWRKPEVINGCFTNVQRQAATLAEFTPSGQLDLRVVPGETLVNAVKLVAEPNERFFLWRLALIRVGAQLCESENAQGLVTSDWSEKFSAEFQALLSHSSHVTRLPVFRPLEGLSGDDLRIRLKEVGVREEHAYTSPFQWSETTSVPTWEGLGELEREIDLQTLVRRTLLASERVTVPSFLRF